MKKVEFHFVTPQSVIGQLVAWRASDVYSHSWISLDGVMYDPLPIWSKKHVEPIDYGDLVITIDVEDDVYKAIEAHCENWVGTFYDFLGILGWMFGLGVVQNSNHTYCHEFCHEIITMITGKNGKHRLISANHLIEELIDIGGTAQKFDRIR